jgi:hypothetical protein
MELKSNYQGSETTKNMVEEQIRERWGDELASQYDPYVNCLPFRKWTEAGYKIKAGEKALKSITYVEVKDKNGEVIRKYPRTISLFFIAQVEKVR